MCIRDSATGQHRHTDYRETAGAEAQSGYPAQHAADLRMRKLCGGSTRGGQFFGGGTAQRIPQSLDGQIQAVTRGLTVIEKRICSLNQLAQFIEGLVENARAAP